MAARPCRNVTVAHLVRSCILGITAVSESNMPYTAPLKDIRFCLQHVAEANNLAEMPMFAEATAETVDAVRLCGAGRRRLDGAGGFA